MFQKINQGAKWCVNALLTTIAVLLTIVIAALAMTVVTVGHINNWLTAP